MTNKPKFTPGPWHRNIKPKSKYPAIFAGRNTHITALKTQGLTDDEIEANCNLIVAAPELYKALKETKHILNKVRNRIST